MRLQSSGAGIYFIVYAASVLAAFIKTLYIATALVPMQMGWFISLSLVSALMIYFCNLGIMDAYLIRTRSIQRREAPAALLRGQLYLFVTVMSGTATALILAFAYIYLPLQGEALNLALAVTYLFLQPLQAALLIDLQADRKLIKYASYTLIKSAVPLIVIATAISLKLTYVDINFVLMCEVVTTGALIGITVNNYRHRLILKFRPMLIMRLSKQGFYFTGHGLLNNLTSNLDKWFVLTSYGLASAGAYSISNQMILAGTAISGMITTYMIPNMTVNEANRSEVIKYLSIWSAALATAGAFISITIIYVFWEYVTHYYYQYSLTFETFAFAAATMAVIGTNFYEVYFRAVKYGKQYFYIQVASNLLLIILLSFVFFLSLNYSWVALSVLFVKMFIWATCFFIARHHSKLK